jgi:hypothetical protein
LLQSSPVACAGWFWAMRGCGRACTGRLWGIGEARRGYSSAPEVIIIIYYCGPMAGGRSRSKGPWPQFSHPGRPASHSSELSLFGLAGRRPLAGTRRGRAAREFLPANLFRATQARPRGAAPARGYHWDQVGVHALRPSRVLPSCPIGGLGGSPCPSYLELELGYSKPALLSAKSNLNSRPQPNNPMRAAV